jgi:DnaJ-class molecular chaperone
MAYFVRCSDCSGTGLLSDPVEPCVYCEGQGYREERQPTDAELRAAVRHAERCLFEPGYAMALLYLAGIPAIEREALGKES